MLMGRFWCMCPYMSEYDVRVSVGDRVRNRSTWCVYTVKGVRPSSPRTLLVGPKPKGRIQDVILVDRSGEERFTAAVSGCVMGCHWEKV